MRNQLILALLLTLMGVFLYFQRTHKQPEVPIVNAPTETIESKPIKQSYGFSRLLFGAPKEALDCPSSYEMALLDTPSGDLDAGYYLEGYPPPANASTTLKIAHIIGKKWFSLCKDKNGKQYKKVMMEKQYKDLALPNAGKPIKYNTDPDI